MSTQSPKKKKTPMASWHGKHEIQFKNELLFYIQSRFGTSR